MYLPINDEDSNQISDYAPDPPSSPQHALVYATALLAQTERALTDVRRHQSPRNTNAIAAALTAAANSHKVAESWVASARQLIEDKPLLAPLTNAYDQLLSNAQQCGEEIANQMDSTTEIINERECDPHTIHWYINRMQPVHSLAAFRYINAMLSAEHDHDATWNEQYRSACIETMEQLADQPQMAPMAEEHAREVQISPDGFTDAKHETQEAYEQATKQTAELCQQALKSYNENLPLVISPAMQQFPDICADAAQTSMSTLQVYPGFFCSSSTITTMLTDAIRESTDQPVEVVPIPDATELHDGYVAYVAYIHDGQKNVQAIADPYPKGFPSDQAMNHMEAALESLDNQAAASNEQHPTIEWFGFRELIQARMDSAMMEMHDVTKADLLSIINTAKQLKLPHGARIALIEAATNWEPNIAHLILKGTGHASPRLASKKQASAIIKAAQQAGLDPYKLTDLADYLGFDGTQLGVSKPKVSKHVIAQIEKVARQAALPEESIEAMLFELQHNDDFIITKRDIS